jgi:O-antigen/teichoic acid export membrane protein
MIVSVIKNTFFTIFDGITPSVGNLCATDMPIEDKFSVFKTLMLLNSWLSGFCAASLFILLNPFINLWLGKEYLLDLFSVAMIVFSFYINTTMSSIGQFRSATGLFFDDRFYSVAQCIINIVVSIVLVKPLGVAGIFVGTCISMLATTFWKQACLVYRVVFKKSPILYFILYLKYFMVSLMGLVLTELVANLFVVTPMVDFVIKMICCIIVFNMVFIIAFARTSEFADLFGRGKALLGKIFNR